MTRRFGKLATELGHGYTLYGFRHFVATQLGAVATTATIRERMGHGSLQVTSGYVHRVSEAGREAARHMDGLFDGETDLQRD
jgi:integrase